MKKKLEEYMAMFFAT